jgi:hypothetical protein
MKKSWAGILGMIACCALPLCADGFSQEDQELIAEKGYFPDDPDDGKEGTLPGSTMADDSEDGESTPDSSDDDDDQPSDE